MAHGPLSAVGCSRLERPQPRPRALVPFLLGGFGNGPLPVSENLHRAELSALERDEQIAKWIALADKKRISVQPAPKSTRERPESGVNAAARELGIDGVALGHLRCGPSVREDRTT